MTAPEPAAPNAPPEAHAAASPVVAEAMKKAAVAWVAAPGRPATALWCLPLDGGLYVVTGAGEQQAPGLADAATAVVTLRGDHGGRIVTWPAAVTRVAPETDEWEAVVPQLAGKRLNAPGSADALAARWAAECVVQRLAPAGAPIEAGATLPDTGHAEAPRESTAIRPARRPFRLHRVRRPDRS